ncbi:zona pellucida-like domain-containing protein 1 [Plectropomus leopardus]|uniref:zona pellucida-like domain-containing protein 1 n=1 Tax=Plectropomus leopardus TaxID=160734 RepID=UPI001C4CC130|nr:zona pellucida-like domain-containing protein 1 [Plectropomus leopardus]
MLQTMRLVILVCLILRTEAPIPDACLLSNTKRPKEYSDITVICSTEHIEVRIYLCSVYEASYNESLMVLNNQFNRPECFGTADWSANPPLLKFTFPLNEIAISSCQNNFKIFSQVGTGMFLDFSDVQFVNISGTITSVNPTVGTITYRQQVLYSFSCLYPMQYILDNTQLAVSGASLAIKDTDGSFISTLSIELYEDDKYEDILNMPQTGLPPQTRIFVAVKATDLTDRFNVLLVRCYASTYPYPTPSAHYDLFEGCRHEPRTKLDLNGESQEAHFSFEAFRFVEHKNLVVSTFYLHCVARLCEVSLCSSLKPDCGPLIRMWKREAQYTPNSATVTSPAIRVGKLSTGVTVRYIIHEQLQRPCGGCNGL